MADVTREYCVVYVVQPGQALAGNKSLADSFDAVNRAATAADAACAKVGQGTSKVTTTATKAKNLSDQLYNVAQAATAAQVPLQALGTSFGTMGGQVDTAVVGVGAFTLGLRALHSVISVVEGLNEQTKELWQYWKDLANFTQDYRDRMRELGNLKGEPGPTNKVMADALDFSLATGAMPDKAEEALRKYENLGPVVRQMGRFGKDPAKAKALEKETQIEVGRTAQRMGIDQGTAQELLGQVALHGDISSKEDAMNRIGGALWGIQKGKLDYTKGVTALNKATAKLMQPIKGEEGIENAKASRLGTSEKTQDAEAGVYLGAMSLGTGTADQAHMRMVQISRTLNDSNPEVQKELQALGITESMTDQDKLIQFTKAMKGKGDPIKWMEEKKIGSKATREAIAQGMTVAGTLEQDLATVRGDAKKGVPRRNFGAQVMAENADYQANDRNAVGNQQRANEAVRKIVIGEQQELYNIAIKNEESRMEKEYRGSWAETFDTNPISKHIAGMLGYNKESRARDKVHQRLQQQVETAGLSAAVKKKFPGVLPDMDAKGNPIPMRTDDPEYMQKYFNWIAPQLKAQGLDPFGVSGDTADLQGGVNAMRTGDAMGANWPKPPGVPANRKFGVMGPQAPNAGGAPQAGAAAPPAAPANAHAANGGADALAGPLEKLVALTEETNAHLRNLNPDSIAPMDHRVSEYRA